MVPRFHALDLNFPPKSLLWPGAVLQTIAHAIAIAPSPLLAYEQSWNARTYSIQNTQGLYGTIAFGSDPSSFVGVMLSENFDPPWPAYTPSEPGGFPAPLKTVPATLRDLAREALQYMLRDDEGCGPLPTITTAFWSDPGGESVAAAQPWGEVLMRGARLVEAHTWELPAALNWIVENYEFSEGEMGIVRDLHGRRSKHWNGIVPVTPEEAAKIRDYSSGNEAGWRACRQSLSEIGIELDATN